MKTITEQIVERLEQLANEWSNHTPQCEALFMAAKEALTFQEKEKEVMKSCIIMGFEFIPVNPNYYNEDAELLYNETFNTKEK